MPYNTKQLADIAGISVRTLHFYDETGLLKPNRNKNNGYRSYEEKELLQLQQILFFRELDFSIQEIKRIMSAPHFDMLNTLRDQKRLIELKKNRLNKLIQTIDHTMQKINNHLSIPDTELYGNFSKAEMENFVAEARQKWGQTEAFRQSQVRVKQMGPAGLKSTMAAATKRTTAIAQAMQAQLNPESEPVQQLIAEHYQALHAFYTPTVEIYRGLATLYIADKRFSAYYEAFAPGLAQFMHDAMMAYCALQTQK